MEPSGELVTLFIKGNGFFNVSIILKKSSESIANPFDIAVEYSINGCLIQEPRRITGLIAAFTVDLTLLHPYGCRNISP